MFFPQSKLNGKMLIFVVMTFTLDAVSPHLSRAHRKNQYKFCDSHKQSIKQLPSYWFTRYRSNSLLQPPYAAVLISLACTETINIISVTHRNNQYCICKSFHRSCHCCRSLSLSVVVSHRRHSHVSRHHSCWYHIVVIGVVIDIVKFVVIGIVAFVVVRRYRCCRWYFASYLSLSLARLQKQSI